MLEGGKINNYLFSLQLHVQSFSSQLHCFCLCIRPKFKTRYRSQNMTRPPSLPPRHFSSYNLLRSSSCSCSLFSRRGTPDVSFNPWFLPVVVSCSCISTKNWRSVVDIARHHVINSCRRGDHGAVGGGGGWSACTDMKNDWHSTVSVCF